MRWTWLQWMFFAAIVVGAALAVLGPQIQTQLSENFESLLKKEAPAIAKITSLEGTVQVLQPGKTEWKKASGRETRLHHKDRVVTQRRSSATVSFDSGYELGLSDMGHFRIESWDPSTPDAPVYVVVIQGHVVMNRQGATGKLYILKDDALFVPEQTPESQPSPLVIGSGDSSVRVVRPGDKKAAASNEPKPATPATPSPTDGLPETLSNEVIDDAIAEQRMAFQKCQANSLRESGSASGKVVLALTIDGSGRINEVKTLESQVTKDLERCVVSVIERIRLPAFTGAPIVRSYPLAFE